MQEIEYEDFQKFMDKTFVLMIMTIYLVVAMTTIFLGLKEGKVSIPIIIALFGLGLIAGVFLSLRLYVGMDSKGVHYQFRPFHFRLHTIPMVFHSILPGD